MAGEIPDKKDLWRAMSITKNFPGNDDRRDSNAFLKKLFTPRSHKICFSFVNVFSAAAPAGHQIAAGPMEQYFTSYP